MYLHIIYKNGEKGGIDLTGKESFVISDDFDSDVYVDTPINTTVLVQDNKLQFEGLASDVVVEHVVKDGDFYELPCSILTDNINLIFTPKEKSLEDFEYKSPEDISTMDEPTSEEDQEDSVSEAESIEQLVKPNAASSADAIKDKPKPPNNNTSKAPQKTSNKKNLIYIGVILGSVLLVLLLFVIYKNRHHKKSGPTATVQQKAAVVKPATLEEIIAKIEKSYPKIMIRQNNNKTYDLVGVVDTKLQITQISTITKPFKASINLQLFDLATIKSNISSVFKKYNIAQYSVTTTDTNTLLIKYFGNDNTDVDAIQSDIVDRYPTELEDTFSIQVSTSNELQDVLDNLVKKYPTISTKIENGIVTINGSISEENKENVNLDITEIETTYQGLLKFVRDIKLSTQILPIKITMVYTGYPSWIILDNGKQIYQGEDYNGFVLQKITENKVIFSGKYTVEIPIT